MEKLKITVIDDNKSVVDLIKEVLEKKNFSVSFAYGGKSGLEVIKKEKPDLVLLDIIMPDMYGNDVLAALKKDKDTKDIPVIMLTAKDEQFDRVLALEQGAYEYITKPIDVYALLRQINNTLEKRKKGKI